MFDNSIYKTCLHKYTSRSIIIKLSWYIYLILIFYILMSRAWLKNKWILRERVCERLWEYINRRKGWRAKSAWLPYSVAKMAAENAVESTDFPMKRQREEDGENGVSQNIASTVSKDQPQPNGLSAVIPGWFSEISPMWPGLFFYSSLSIPFSSSSQKFTLFILFLHSPPSIFKLVVSIIIKTTKPGAPPIVGEGVVPLWRNLDLIILLVMLIRSESFSFLWYYRLRWFCLVVSYSSMCHHRKYQISLVLFFFFLKILELRVFFGSCI